MTLRDDVEKELRAEIIKALEEGMEGDFNEFCPGCIKVIDALVEIALRYSGFDTKDLRKKAADLQLGKVRD